MRQIRLVFLWHMHQPFYKDLVSGEYRLPWVRLHALKDYYGMVKLLDEFPGVHQTFNLVPSLIAQLEDYVNGKARDPFFDVATKPARDLSPAERQFALAYLFQANPTQMIARYPRYEELYSRLRGAQGSLERALARFTTQDFADLQVFSQIVWFDEFFLEQPEVAELVGKERGFTVEDQRLMSGLQREFMARVLPAYAEAAKRGAIEISTSPYYHPILPLLCDTDMGAVSSPGLKLPQRRFQHPEDAQLQLQRALELHERVFGLRPRGAWPSEGSVSDEVLRIAQAVGLEWLATDEEVLARSLQTGFGRDAKGNLYPDSAGCLYRIYGYLNDGRQLHLLFRDRVLSDLIGFVYSGMPAKEAAENFIGKIKDAAAPVLASGRDAVVAVILDGENAWEYYPQSGREFLRRLYDGLQRDPQIQAITVSEAIQAEALANPANRSRSGIAIPGAGDAATRSQPAPTSADERGQFERLESLVPGSWINANFNVWIGAPEDNRAWDYLAAARDFYANYGTTASASQRALALEEILVAEGSDWNWWYGPEHHSANDRDFDELYRKHLSNVYLVLNGHPPDYLAQPIAVAAVRPAYVPQTAYIHPRIGAEYERYFDWIGAAMYGSDRHRGAMHGKQFLLDRVYAGIDESNLYGRVDFAVLTEEEFELRVNLECVPPDGSAGPYAVTLEVAVGNRAIRGWRLRESAKDKVWADSENGHLHDIALALRRNFDFRIPLTQLSCGPQSGLRLRFGLWRDGLPLDALPLEGWMELHVAPEEDLQGGMYNYSIR